MSNIYCPASQKQLYPVAVTERDIKDLMLKYSFKEWLGLLTLLQFKKSMCDSREQIDKKLVDSILTGDVSFRLKFYIEESRKIDQEFKSIIFNFLQLNYLRKHCFLLYGDFKNERDLKEDLGSVAITKIFLGANDVVFEKYEPLYEEFKNEVTEEEKREFFVQTFNRQAFLQQQDSKARIFYRFYKMFYQQPEDHDGYLDFKDAFKDNLGMVPKKFFSTLFALLGPLFSASNEDIDNIKFSELFKNPIFYLRGIETTPENIKTVVNRVSATPKQIKEELLKKLKEHNKGYFLHNNASFTYNPFIILSNGDIACCSVNEIFRKLSNNFFWVLKKGYEGNWKEDFLNDFRSGMFEEYVRFLISKFYSDDSKIEISYHEDGSTEEGDILIRKKDTLIIIEAKSKQYKAEGRFKAEGDFTRPEFLENTLIQASDQIEKAYDRLQNKNKYKEINKVYPVLVTFDTAPTNFGNISFYRSKVSQRGFLNKDIFQPLEIMDIGELENLLGYAKKMDFIDVLNSKNKSFNKSFAAFLNTLNLKRENWEKKSGKKSVLNCYKNIYFKIRSDLYCLLICL